MDRTRTICSLNCYPSYVEDFERRVDAIARRRRVVGQIEVVRGELTRVGDTMVIPVDILGHIPAVPGGWKAVGVVSLLKGDDGKPKTIVRSFGEDLDKHVSERAFDDNHNLVCEHCHTSRRRSQAFVLVTPEGDRRQVGSTCLQRYNAPEAEILAVARLFEVFKEIRGLADEFEEEFRGGAVTAHGYVAEKWLTAVAGAISSEGFAYVSRATADRYYLKTTYTIAQEKIRQRTLFTEQDLARAEEVLEWMKSLSEDDESEYLSSLAVLGRCSWWPREVLGIAASAFQAKARMEHNALPEAVQWVPKPQMKASGRKPNKVYTPKPNTFQDCTATVVGSMAGMDSTLLKLRTDDGAELGWWCSDMDLLRGLWLGDRLTLKGRIKGTREFRGVPSTTINFVKAEKL